MILPRSIPSGSVIKSAAKLASVCAVAFALVQAPLAIASDGLSLRQLDDKAPALPVSTSVTKNASSDGGPYVLTLLNTGKGTLTVGGKVQLAVQSHSALKVRDIPVQAIDAGKTRTIADLSAGDKVTLTADGYAPLEVTVP